jgi:phytoene dehydrogenase-like protein
MKKKIIIIGAGIAGLAAGCYGQLNGYDTEILEMHDLPGGLCTAWTRRGYTFDGCIHWLVGANPHSQLYVQWQAIGALKGKEFVRHEIVTQIEGDNGKKLILYADMDRLEQHLLELSPADATVIKEFTDVVRSRADWQKIINPDPHDKYNTMSGQEFIEQFQDPFLREAFAAVVPGGHLGFFLLQLVVYNNRDAAWPIGGSLEFAKGIERRYLELGGSLHYRAKVTEILVRENRAMGIRLADGSVFEADYLISAADGYTTVFQMLKGQFVDPEIRRLYETAKVTPSSVQVSLGVDYDLAGEPDTVNLKLDQPLQVGNRQIARLQLRHYGYDPTMCPAGKSVVTTLIRSDYEYWEQRYGRDREAYREEKRRIGAAVGAVFEKRFPAAKGKIEVVDVATPLTYHRYTITWKGAYMGWLNPEGTIPVTLPGLQGFYMAGQWTSRMSGLPTGLMTGRGSIMRVCQVDGKEFVEAGQDE